MEYLQYLSDISLEEVKSLSFKPYYKWNTFNTDTFGTGRKIDIEVLNLIINGIPSIL